MFNYVSTRSVCVLPPVGTTQVLAAADSAAVFPESGGVHHQPVGAAWRRLQPLGRYRWQHCPLAETRPAQLDTLAPKQQARGANINTRLGCNYLQNIQLQSALYCEYFTAYIYRLIKGNY